MIQTLDWREHVWLRPNLYFEKCFQENNLNNIVLEAFCPAIDEYFDGNCSEIRVGINKNLFQIEYNAGMELREVHGSTLAEIFMTKLMACKSEKKHLKVGEEYCLLGLATINAVTDRCELETILDKQKGHFIFQKGHTILKEISETEIAENSTKISFEMSKDIFGELIFEFDDLQMRLNSLKERLPNLKIELNRL